MAEKLFHQAGHNTNWNIDSMQIDKAGDGIILSPVHYPKQRVENLDSDVKSLSIFDPQFYLPNSQKKKLKTYEFFPETISGGFKTTDYSIFALESAKRCLDFQIENDFSHIVIPTRFFSQMESNFIERQEELSVKPFALALKMKNPEKPVLLTLAITSHMVLNEHFRINLLNWVTSIEQVDGVYLIVEYERSTKQITDGHFILSMLLMISELRDADLEVVVGYCNTESLLYMTLTDVSVTFGAFENTRQFSLDKFIESEEQRRGPKARIYFPKLLNWITFEEARRIRENHPEHWDRIYSPTSYAEAAFERPIDPTFNQPDLYKHHFILMQSQCDQMRSLTSENDRFEFIRDGLQEAVELYKQLDSLPLLLEEQSLPRHLEPWLRAATKFHS